MPSHWLASIRCIVVHLLGISQVQAKRGKIFVNADELIHRYKRAPNMLALGPSSLESIANGDIVLKDSIRIVLPDNFMRLLDLIRNGSHEHRMFLIRMIRYFSPPYGRYRVDAQYQDHVLIDRILEVIAGFRNEGRVQVLEQEYDDPELTRALSKLYPGQAFEISLSPRRNFLRDYLVRIYSWSKMTGGMIIERTRRVFSDIGRHIAALQLPDMLDDCVDMKSKYIEQAFSYRGGKAVKFFVAGAISVAGLTYYPAGLVGVVIAFADP